jgi:hypothetical protein
MQNHETKKNSHDISVDKLQQLIRAVALLRKMLKDEHEAKRRMMAMRPGTNYQESRFSFSNN